MPIYNTYIPGEHYLFNPMAIDLKRFAHLPRKEFLEKYYELKKKYEEED